jgi:serine/threonine protein kinase
VSAPTDSQLSPSLHAGDVIGGRFRLLNTLGAGSIGIVWLAEDLQLDNERLACKVLREDMRDRRDTVSDLKREVLMTRKLRHPNILSLYTFWETVEAQFVTMEYVEGTSLADALANRRSPFTLPEVLPWVRDLAEALDYAHGQGVLHRDVKPANVLLSNDGRVCLADFGIARFARGGDTETTPSTEGTIYFMSPEQLLGGGPDPRSDLYSLAASAYLLLNGLPPFHEGEIVSQIQVRAAPPVPTLPEAVNRELLRALSKSPSKRHSTCRAFYEMLRNAAQSSGETIQLNTPIRHTWTENAPTMVMGDFGVETRRTRLGKMLIERGLVTQDHLAEALIDQRQSGGKLGAVLIRHGRLSDTALATALSEQLRTSTTRVTDGEIDGATARTVSREIAEKHLVLPMKRARFGVLAAMVDPLDMEALNALETAFGESIEPLVATEQDLHAAIARVYGE